MLRKCAVFVVFFLYRTINCDFRCLKKKQTELVLKQIISLPFDDFWLTDWLSSGEQMFASDEKKKQHEISFFISFMSLSHLMM